jgi:hypothetical protein
MANLVENAEWVDGIYQLETTDLVEGGPDGVDNIQAIQLAKRTQFLKALILAAQNSLAGHEAAADPHPQYLTMAEGNSLIATAVSALVNSSPATLDTLNELAAALDNNPNFATTITTALGNKQPLDQTLTALAALATTANKLIYATGSDTFSTTNFTAFARTLLDDADAETMRATIGAYGISEVMTLFSATGNAPVYACRAWVSFNGTGTVAISGSGNVSSITDNGTGDYTVNFTTAMPDANYSIGHTCSGNTWGGSNPGIGIGPTSAPAYTKTVSVVRLFAAYWNGIVDFDKIMLQFFR